MDDCSPRLTRKHGLIIGTAALTSFLCHPDFMWRFPYWMHAVFATVTASVLIGVTFTILESRIQRKLQHLRRNVMHGPASGAVVWADQRSVSPTAAPAARVYHVPHRFGLGTMACFTLFFSLLALCLRWMNASAATSLAALGFFAVIGFLQMVWRAAPRAASAIAGAAMLPLFFATPLAIEGNWRAVAMIVVPVTALGALAGYFGGAIFAGMFMLWDCFTGSTIDQQDDAR